MKNFLSTIILCIVFLAGFIEKISGQPVQDDFIPCHHGQQHLKYRHQPSELEIQMMENSNKRSDSIDIINYTIDLDITNYAGKAIKAATQIYFMPLLDQIEWIQLDLKSLTVDSILYDGKAIAFNYDGDIITAFLDLNCNRDKYIQCLFIIKVLL
ncbi:MAG: hypothetical protein IPM34_11070 [Saprospiraceae bacterium]|nr:hypothetical protein [Saprospiraceae bacterium]